MRQDPHDYPDGQYFNRCIGCGYEYIGWKYGGSCALCAKPPKEAMTNVIQLRPLQDKILVRHIPTVPKSELLYVPPGDTEKMTFGEVIAIGPRVAVVQPEDQIVFHTHIGQYLERDGIEYTILREAEVEAITMRDGLR